MAFLVRCEQLHPDPDLGPLKHDHKLTLIFFSLHENDLLIPWIKRGDPGVIWPRDWLPKEEEGLGNNILVLSVRCFVDPMTQFLKPLEEILVQDLVMKTKWGLNRAQTMVLVGYGLGGLVMKSLIIKVHELSKSKDSHGESQGARCKAFEQNIKSIVFYGVPHTTSWEEFVNYCKSYAMMIQHVDKVRDMVFLNGRFEESIAQHINLFAFVEGQKVPQSSTYKLVQNNVCEIDDADHFQVSQPLDQRHASYKRLMQLIQEDLAHTQKLDAMIRTIKDLEQTQKLDVMIRTIEDVHINFPRDLQFLALKEVLGKTSIVCVGGKAMEGDSVEFLFMHAGDMAKVVGVGLDWAKVVVTKKFGVNVVQEDEGIWTKLWCSEHFVPRIITVPNPKQELVTHPNSAKTDGFELDANLGRVYVEDDKEENAYACFPLVFELAEHIGLGIKNAMKMKEVSRAESSVFTKGGEVSGAESSKSTKGGEVSGAESSKSTKGGEVSGAEPSKSTKGGEVSGAESSKSTKGGEVSGAESSKSTKGGEVSGAKSSGPTKGGEVSGAESSGATKGGEVSGAEEKTLIVNVYPKAGKLTRNPTLWEGPEPPPPTLWADREPPSICPILVFEFQKKGEWRMIKTKTVTSCNFGELEDVATENDFPFYQDDITISLKCMDYDAARVTETCVQDVENVKTTMTDTSATMKSSGHQPGFGIGLIDKYFHGHFGYVHTRSAGTNSTQGRNHDVPFVQLGHYHVNDRCLQKELKYNFQYPQHVLQQIASSDLSGIRTENTFSPTIVGEWVNLKGKMSRYVFSVQREIVSKEKLRRSKTVVGDPPHTRIQYEVSYERSTNKRSEAKQPYEVELKINHAMTNMPQKVVTRSLSENENIIDVMEMSSSISETI